ncbi:hypothetical protein B0H14DRAFT_2600841 [Mycena olivaceomarginata]|nr:hypothetical protein B0H14DRAFT_2600841 [Mycena olivaceomarginata]
MDSFVGTEHKPPGLSSILSGSVHRPSGKFGQKCRDLTQAKSKISPKFVGIGIRDPKALSGCNLEPDPQLNPEPLNTLGDLEPTVPEPPDRDSNTRPEEPEVRDHESDMDPGEMEDEYTAKTHISDSDVNREYAKPGIVPAELIVDDGDIIMGEEAKVPPPMPCTYAELTDIAMKLFTQDIGSEDRTRWFRRIAMSLQNKRSEQVSEFYHYCSENHLL